MLEITIFLIVSLVVAIVFLLRTIFEVVRIPKIDIRLGPGTSFVSVIVPVRNEMGRVLQDSLTSLMNQNYAAMELIVVDDRSTDGSLECIRDTLSKSLLPYKIVTADIRPPSWNGKTWALSQGRNIARGEWLLLVDSDVIFHASAVSSVMKYANDGHIEAVSGLSKIHLKSFWERSILPSLFWLSLMRVTPGDANDPRSRACFGFGHMILVSRNAHDAIGGFQSYRSHVLDDCAVMELTKGAGFRVRVVNSSMITSGQMYDSLRAIYFGFSKNSYASIGYSPTRLFMFLAAEMAFVLLPCLAFIYTAMDCSATLVTSLGGINILILIIIHAVLLISMRSPIYLALFFPIGHFAAVVIMLNSAISYISGRGVLWKGRAI